MLTTFKGTPLTNMYNAKVTINGRTFDNSEAAFQSFKTTSKLSRDRFVGIDGYSAKRLGRELPLRGDWETIKVQIMKKVLRAKFTQSKVCLDFLLSTVDDELIEWNAWHDNTWGVCTCNRCKTKIGSNILGKLLAQLREELACERRCNVS